jgi:hypothetical protein
MKVGTSQKMITVEPEAGIRILSGKIPGMQARGRFDLDALDAGDSEVWIKITAPVVTSSFILGMFSKSVRKLGFDGFFKKYHFDATADVLENIRANALVSTNDETALSMRA